jgi:hypothetical protein
MGGPGSGRKAGSGKSSRKGQNFSAGSSKGSRARVLAQRKIGAAKMRAAGLKPKGKNM